LELNPCDEESFFLHLHSAYRIQRQRKL
jgi:hypothetical protein